MLSKTVQDTTPKMRRDPELSTFSFINMHSYFFGLDAEESEPEGSPIDTGKDNGAIIVVDGRPGTQRSGSTSSNGSEPELPRSEYMP